MTESPRYRWLHLRLVHYDPFSDIGSGDWRIHAGLSNASVRSLVGTAIHRSS